MNDYFIAPNGANAATPSIVLIMHLYGVDASMRDAANQFAGAGFAVAVPDLYARFDAPAPNGEENMALYLPYAQQLTTEGIDEDIDRSVNVLRSQFPQTRIGIVGFCMGGRIAMVRCTGYDTFAAAAIWYGLADNVDPARVDIPIIASYGGADAHIPTDKVETFFADVPTEHDVKIYHGAEHGFFHKHSAYAPEAAADSFSRTVAFLRRYLT